MLVISVRTKRRCFLEEVTATLEALDEEGVLPEHLTLIRKNGSVRRRIADLIKSGGYQPTTSQKLAREIMGKNFFGVEEAVQHLGVKPTKAQLSALVEVLYTEAELREVKSTHVLVAVFPLSILDIRGKLKRELFYRHEDAWYNNQEFAKDKGEVGWYPVRKTSVPNSTSKTWSEQQALLAQNEETPKAQEMVCTIIGHFLATGERLFENVWVRCSDLASDGDHVCVGDFVRGGLSVRNWWRDNRHGDLGLASSRKFQ